MLIFLIYNFIYSLFFIVYIEISIPLLENHILLLLLLKIFINIKL